MSDEILALYPDDPVLGSPYDTDSETFDLSSTRRHCTTGGAGSPARLEQGRRTDVRLPPCGSPPSEGTDPRYGVDHGVDVQYMFHNLTNAAPELSMLLSEQVMDYWLSFVTIRIENEVRDFWKFLMKVATC
ncbi:hypothetical protein FB107DRAFT_277410 [Schizophyllum commune]